MRGFFAIVSVALASLSVVSAAPSTPANALERRVVGPGRVTGNTAVHDPSMCKDGSGKYFLFATGQGLPIRTSTDRIAWTLVGSVFPNGAPAATKEYTAGGNGDLWAPDCTFVNGQFRLFYAASGFGKQKVSLLSIIVDSGDPCVYH
jgi:arabinan endo-1,5-alpha-L-arabinosidase